jgi:hypothetical protein
VLGEGNPPAQIRLHQGVKPQHQSPASDELFPFMMGIQMLAESIESGRFGLKWMTQQVHV